MRDRTPHASPALTASMQRLALALLLAMVQACAPTRISAPPPQSAQTAESFLCARLDYDGSNTEWLPRAINATPSDPHRLIRYRYEIGYGIDDESAFDLFNPFLILGATKSKDSMHVLGLLEIELDGARLREYREVVNLEKSKSIFSEGETLTDMRRQGLSRLRELMDSRLTADRETLTAVGFGCD
jgi:hypothetical protein